jgi:hypothetical protein
MIYDVKHDVRYKSRSVAGGHLIDLNTENVYSGVIPLCGKHALWGADIGDAYLEA